MSHSPEHENPQPESQPPKDADQARAGKWTRRRFGQAVAASAPVIMTLHSRPLQAAAANCTVSGWVSGNTSLHHELRDCGGRTPGYWQGPQSKRDHPTWENIHRERLDSPDGFPGIGPYYVSEANDDGSQSVREATLQDAVDRSVAFGGLDNLDRQIVRFGTAALLNARFDRHNYALTMSQVTEIVVMGLAGGYQAPGGDRLTPRQVKAFLENTMNQPNWGPGTDSQA